MEFLDTPNPNAKKILIDHDFETSIYLDDNSSNSSLEVSILLKTSGIKNIFTGPGFITITTVFNDQGTIIQKLTSNIHLLHIRL